MREKLIELLEEAWWNYRHGKGPAGMPINFAEHLIANGVTIQRWIPVTERLPEPSDPATAVLGITKQGQCHVVYYYKAAINDVFTGFYDSAVKRDITHWMPLPEPPKGE